MSDIGQVEVARGLVRREVEPNITMHPDAITGGEPLLVHDSENKYGGGLVVVRGADKVMDAYERGETDFASNVVTAFEGTDGTKRMPTPDEVIAIVKDEVIGDADGESTLVEAIVRPMSTTDARAWIIEGGMERSTLPGEHKLMQTLHAFNTLGYFKSSQHETLTRIAAKLGFSMYTVTGAFKAYKAKYPIQQSEPMVEAGWDPVKKEHPNDLALAQAIERIEKGKREQLWKQSPALAALSEGVLPQGLPPGVHQFDAADIKADADAVREHEWRMKDLVRQRSQLERTLESLEGVNDVGEALAKQDMVALRRMIDSGEMAEHVLRAYKGGSFQMVLPDGEVIDGSRVARIEIDAPDGPLEYTDSITVRAFTDDDQPILKVDPHVVPFALVVPHFTCAYEGCGLRLNRYYHPEKDHLGLRAYEWMHGRAMEAMGIPEHDARPVPDAFQPARLICDFCSTLDPEWSLGCNDYEHMLSRARTITHSTDKRWACCARCKALIDEGRMAEVTELAIQSMASEVALGRADVLAAMRESMTEMHQGFLAHRTFDDRRFDEGAPI